MVEKKKVTLSENDQKSYSSEELKSMVQSRITSPLPKQEKLLFFEEYSGLDLNFKESFQLFEFLALGKFDLINQYIRSTLTLSPLAPPVSSLLTADFDPYNEPSPPNFMHEDKIFRDTIFVQYLTSAMNFELKKKPIFYEKEVKSMIDYFSQ
ncbi:hypothetical protein HDU92_008636, partial [Lobulomyces angularis]